MLDRIETAFLIEERSIFEWSLPLNSVADGDAGLIFKLIQNLGATLLRHLKHTDAEDGQQQCDDRASPRKNGPECI